MKEIPTPEKDLERGEKFTESPNVLITDGDLLAVADIDTVLSPTYKRCSNCVLRNAEPPCEFYIKGGICQIERSLFKSYLQDLKERGVTLKDRILVMTGFIHWVNVWRNYAIESSRNESYIHSTKEGSELSKYRHKNINDHTKSLLTTLRELEATRKTSKKKDTKKNKEDLANLFIKSSN